MYTVSISVLPSLSKNKTIFFQNAENLLVFNHFCMRDPVRAKWPGLRLRLPRFMLCRTQEIKLQRLAFESLDTKKRGKLQSRVYGIPSLKRASSPRCPCRKERTDNRSADKSRRGDWKRWLGRVRVVNKCRRLSWFGWVWENHWEHNEKVAWECVFSHQPFGDESFGSKRERERRCASVYDWELRRQKGWCGAFGQF